MTIPKIPGHYSRNVIRRFPKQAIRVDQIHSCQQEISVVGFTAAELAAFQTGPPLEDYASVTVDDVNQILPYTTLEFTVDLDAPFQADTEYSCNLFVTTGQTAAQASAQLATQINAYAATWGAVYPDMVSLRSTYVATPTPHFMIYMPFGMLGPASFVYNLPGGIGAAAGGYPGVDNPLIFGILGKRRHVFGVRYPYRDDYYGDVAIG